MSYILHIGTANTRAPTARNRQLADISGTGRPAGLASAVIVLEIALAELGVTLARPHLEEGRCLYWRLGDRSDAAKVLHNPGVLANILHDHQAA